MWEKIPDKTQSSERLKVPGGWVVRILFIAGVHTGAYSHTLGTPTVSMILVPDPNHEWVLTPENE